MRGRNALMACAVMMMSGIASGGQEKTVTPPAEKMILSPETFLELRGVRDPQFSPDGACVAFVVDEPRTGEKRKRHIWLYDKQSDSTRQLTYSLCNQIYRVPHGATTAHRLRIDCYPQGIALQ